MNMDFAREPRAQWARGADRSGDELGLVPREIVHLIDASARLAQEQCQSSIGCAAIPAARSAFSKPIDPPVHDHPVNVALDFKGNVTTLPRQAAL